MTDYISCLQININAYLLLSLIASYLIGSISFGIILAKFLGVDDLRTKGSGNTGATNVMRNCGKIAGLITLVLDALKGAIIIVISQVLDFGFSEFELACIGLFSIVGHIFPIWHHFKGGKGVATAFGVFMALDLSLGCVFLVVWVITILLCKMASVASLLALIFVVSYSYYSGANYCVSMVVFITAIIIIYKHKSNIINIIKGKENKIKLF